MVANSPIVINDKELTLFGIKGLVCDKKWIMNVPFGVNPEPASPLIESCIHSNYETEKYDRIKHIQVSPNVGVCLYLEDRVTKAMLKDADVSTEGVVVLKQIPFNIPSIGTRTYDVNVVKNSECAFSIIDTDGNVV